MTTVCYLSIRKRTVAIFPGEAILIGALLFLTYTVWVPFHLGHCGVAASSNAGVMARRANNN